METYQTPDNHNPSFILNGLRQNKTKMADVQMSDYFAERLSSKHTQSVLEATSKMHKYNNYF